MIQKIKEWLIRQVIERRIKKMLDSIKTKLEGKKTYITAGIGILVALVGVLWGPIEIGGLTIPEYSVNEFFSILWASGLFAFLHAKK